MLVVGTHFLDGPGSLSVGLGAFLLGGVESWTMYRLDRRFPLHHRHAAGGPAENEVGVEALTCHRVVPGARGVIDGEDDLRHARSCHRLDETSTGTDDALLLFFRADHEARHILHEEERNAGAIAPVDEVRDFLRTLGVDDAAETRLLTLTTFDQAALIGDHANVDAIDARIATNHFASEISLKLIDLAIVEDGAEDVVHVVGHAVVAGQHIVERLRRWLDTFAALPAASCGISEWQALDEIADLAQTFFIVVDLIMGDAADLRVRRRAAEGLGVDNLPGRTFHQVRTAESHEGGSLHHQDDVGQRGQICTPRNALPHHRCDLWNAQVASHDRVVIEDACGAVLARKDSALIRKVHTRGVDQIHNRDAAAHRDFLGPQNLLDRLRPPGSCLDGRIVGDDDGFPPVHPDDRGYDTRGRGLTVVLIVGNQQSDLEHARIGIAQQIHPLPSGKLALLVQFLEPFRTAGLADLVLKRFYFFAQLAQAIRH